MPRSAENLSLRLTFIWFSICNNSLHRRQKLMYSRMCLLNLQSSGKCAVSGKGELKFCMVTDLPVHLCTLDRDLEDVSHAFSLVAVFSFCVQQIVSNVLDLLHRTVSSIYSVCVCVWVCIYIYIYMNIKDVSPTCFGTSVPSSGITTGHV